MADGLIESLRNEARTRNINIVSLDRNDPQSAKDTGTIQINIHGVDATKSSEFRSMIADKTGDTWDLHPNGPTDYYLTMKPTAVLGLEAYPTH